MVIIICYNIKDNFIAEEIKEYFKEQLPDIDIAWKETRISISANVDISYGKIKDIFNYLIEKYESVDVSALDRYDIEERGSNWWSTVTICSETVNGKKILKEDQSTGWN